MTNDTKRDLVRAERIIDDVLDRDDLAHEEFDILNKLFHDLDDFIDAG